MKYRTGFVSNSSSSSFIVAITRDFKLTEDEIELFREGYQDYHGDPCDFTTEQIHEMVAEIVDQSCKTGMVYSEENSDVWALANALDDSYFIAEINAGCNEGGMVNLLTDKNKDAVLETMKVVVQRCKNLPEMKQHKEDNDEGSQRFCQ